ncbi:MAG: repeat protein [Nitrososphaeraceae archaeon]|nr:repeat protein [Nitrososphaeraceae archaeon]
MVIISLILPLQYSVLKFANGQTIKESQIMIFNSDSKKPALADGKNAILKPKIDVSIEGTTKSDKLMGGMGDDKINGKYGDDVLHGEDGNDKITGGFGDDKISGQVGNDIIKGEKGDDMLFGGHGYDQIYGDIGNDALDGGEGNDIMIGGRGADTFLCNQYDKIIDFNTTEDDRMIGSCKVQSPELTAISDNNTPTQTELQSTQSLSSIEEARSLPPSNANDGLPNFEPILLFDPNDLHSSEFQSLSPLPIPFNDRDIQELQSN